MKKNICLLCVLIAILSLAGCKKCEHQYSEATCTALSACALCGETTGELAAHTYAKATCTTPATCTACGVTEGTTVAHQYADPTCKAPATCTVCGTTEGSVADHKYSEATCAAPATCEYCGLTQGEALAHTFTEATCAAPATCTACGATEGEALAHTFTEATCQEYATCTACGATGTEKGAHKYNKGSCTVCGQRDASYDEIVSILSKIERYPTYLETTCAILDTQIQLYNINGKASVLADIIDTVNDMNGYVNKIREACKDNVRLYPIYSQCNTVKYPGTAGTSTSAIRNYISAAKSFSRQCKHVYEVYNIYAKDYGVR